MADQSLDTGSVAVELKQLSAVNTLKLEEIVEIVTFIGNFFSEDLPQKFGKGFNTPFFVSGFSSQTFRLKKSVEIEDILKLKAELEANKDLSDQEKSRAISELDTRLKNNLENSLFLSDLVAFLEQIQVRLHSLLNEGGKIALNQTLQEDFFNLIGLAKKIDSKHVSLRELRKLEDSSSGLVFWQNVNSRITKPILEIIAGQNKNEEKVKGESRSTGAVFVSPTASPEEQSDPTDDQEDGGGEQQQEEEEKLKTPLPEAFSSEYNLAQLDEGSKLYIRSLAIISVNQAVQMQFANLSSEQLQAMGFKGIPTFDQLPLEARQQLLGIAFEKIENLLVTGQYDLGKLTDQAALRVRFSKDAAIDIMTDIRGGGIFAKELGKITGSDQSPVDTQAQLAKNEAQTFSNDEINTSLAKLQIDAKQLPEGLRQQLSQLSVAEAEQFFTQLSANPELKNSFLSQFQKTFTLVSKDNFLDEWKKIIGDNKLAQESAYLAQANILPKIDALIQQGYPAEYLKYFDWDKFRHHFGEGFVDQKTYLGNQDNINQLLESYWRSQRATWSRDIHRGVGQELYTVDQANNLYEQMSQPVAEGNKQLFRQQNIYWTHLEQQAKFNAVNADAVTKLLAGIEAQEIADINAFNQNQFENLIAWENHYRQSFLDAFNQDQQQQLAILAYYNQLGAAQDNMALNAGSLGFSPYDMGATNYNQLFGQNHDGQYAFQQGVGEGGALGPQLQDGFSAAQNLYDSTIGKGIDFAGEKAVRAGLDYLTAGSFEALPEPIKQMIEKIAWGELKKRLEPILKMLGMLAAAMAAAMLALFAKLPFGKSGVGSAQAALGGNKNVLETGLLERGGGLSLGDQAVVAQNTQARQLAATQQQQLAQGQRAQAAQAAQAGKAKGLFGNLGQGAMATAGQAVIGAFSLVAAGTLFYQMLISGAFLTQFPTGGLSRGVGSAIFCNGVNVGSLTYYSQKAADLYALRFISPPNCVVEGSRGTFGASACGPVAVAMILNQDPLQMSINEGYVSANGAAGKTTCRGTGIDYLIETLQDHGVNLTAVPTPQGSPEAITAEISNYLAEGNILFVLTYTKGFGHYYIITCVEQPGYVAAYDPYWGQNVVHRISSHEKGGSAEGAEASYIRNMYLVKY